VALNKHSLHTGDIRRFGGELQKKKKKKILARDILKEKLIP